MKITAIETIRSTECANLLWLQRPHRRRARRPRRDVLLAADRRGLCARIRRAEGDRPRPARDRPAVAGPGRLSRLPLDAAPRCAATRPSTSRSGTFSARPPGQPIAQLLGGFTRQTIRTYNTCAGTDYMQGRPRARTPPTGVSARRQRLRRPQRLPAPRRRARRRAAGGGHHGDEDLAVRPSPRRRRDGQYISAADLKAALEPFEKIRKRGRRPDGHHGRVPLDVAAPAGDDDRQGARALRHLLARGPDQDGQPRRASGATRRSRPAPICASETLGSALGLPRSPGDRTRPASSCSTSPGAAACRRRARSPPWRRPGTCRSRRTTAPGRSCSAASTHLSLNAPNALVQESVRAFYRTWYRDLVTALPPK